MQRRLVTLSTYRFHPWWRLQTVVNIYRSHKEISNNQRLPTATALKPFFIISVHLISPITMFLGDRRNIVEALLVNSIYHVSFTFYRKVNWGFGCAVFFSFSFTRGFILLFGPKRFNGLHGDASSRPIKCCISWGFWLTIIMTLWSELIAPQFYAHTHERKKLCPALFMRIIYKLICENYDVEIHKYWWWFEGS